MSICEPCDTAEAQARSREVIQNLAAGNKRHVTASGVMFMDSHPDKSVVDMLIEDPLKPTVTKAIVLACSRLHAPVESVSAHHSHRTCCSQLLRNCVSKLSPFALVCTGLRHVARGASGHSNSRECVQAQRCRCRLDRIRNRAVYEHAWCRAVYHDGAGELCPVE